MASERIPLRLETPGEPDRHGRYIFRVVPSGNGHRVATYEWRPNTKREGANGVLFYNHGYSVHGCFGLLSSDEDYHRILYENSLVERLINGLNVVVISFDHIGHGRSTGAPHCYMDSHDEMGDAAIDVIEYFTNEKELKGLPIILMGESMGACNIVRMMMSPTFLKEYKHKVITVLASPAISEPDDSFGRYGKLLKSIAQILVKTVPKLPVLKLPPLENEETRLALQRDGLCYRGGMRVKMGTEFIRVYDEIEEQADEIWFKSVGIFISNRDIFVSPSSMQSFFKRIQSEDKTLFRYADADHDVLRWEAALKDMLSWVKKRLEHNS